MYLNRIYTATFLPFGAYNTDNQLIMLSIGCINLKYLIINDGKETLILSSNNIVLDPYIVGEGLFSPCPLEYVYIGRGLSYETKSSYGYHPFFNYY